jgi:hypothetical protein
MVGSKYSPLQRHLSRFPASTWRAPFSEIEKIVGFRLPESARRHRAWWSNNGSNNVMTKAWKAAGWETEQVDMEKQVLVFRRVMDSANAGTSDVNRSPAADTVPNAPSNEPKKFEFSFGRLKGTVTWNGDPTAPAGEKWDAENGQG